MPSSYTTSLRLTLPATGENSGTWGTLVNTGITELTDTAIAGYVSIAMTDADYTLTVANGVTDQARRMMLNMTGTLTAARNVICPTASKLYVIKNSTTGGFAITLKTSAGTGISIPNGKSMLLMCDGTNVVDAITTLSSLTLASPLLPASGGTGLTALGTGVATFLGTPSSANLAAAVTDETGSGALVFATSPTLVTPALGTPTSGNFSTGTFTWPTFNQNTTGTAAGLSATLVATSGGTGQSSYAVGDLLYASTTTALSKLADVATGNSLISGGVGVAPSWGKIGLTTHVSGTLPVANGGTGITSFGTGIATWLGTPSSANLAAAVTDETGSGALVFGTSPTITSASLVTPALGTPTSGNFSTGTFTWPTFNQNTTGTAAGLSATLVATSGGTGQSSYAVGDLLYASTTTALSKLADVATGNSLISGGVGVAPSWGKIGLTTHVSGTLPIANGGTGATTAAGALTALGGTTVGINFFDLANPSAITFPRINADNTVSALDAATFRTAIGAGTSSATGTVTSVGGTGTVSGITLTGTVTTSGNLTLGGTLAVTASNFASQTANTILAAPNGAAGVPTFRAIVAADIPTLNQNTTGTAANVTGVVAAANGGTGQSSYAVGDLLYASTTTALSKLADVATGNALISGGVGVAPSWGKIGLTTHVSGTLPVANGGTGITSLGAGVATWLGTPSSANLAAAVTDETGSGALVFATSPTITTPTIDGATFTGNAQTTPVAVTFSATAMTVNCADSNVFTTTFTASVTTAPTFSNLKDGQTINWFITQDATGSRTMTWPTSFKWPGGTAGVLSTAANSVDLLVATYRSATGFWYATLSKGFA